MRLQLSTVILALLPLALCDPFADTMDLDVVGALDIRAAQSNPLSTKDTSTLSKPPSGVQVTSFEAFMPFSGLDYDYSRTFFNVLLNPPMPDRAWSATCWVLTNGTLCNPDLWRSCEPVAGAGNENEKVWFKFDHDLTGLNIKRRWTVQGMTMTATASEPATWSESEDPTKSNVTVSELGKCYRRPNGWVLPWKTLVG